MAGFDFEFLYEDEEGYALARRLLRHLQWRARYFGLDMRYSVRRERTVYYVLVDGPLPAMQAFAPRLTLEVFACAEFADEPKPAWRRTDIAHELMYGYSDGLKGITEGVAYLDRTFRRTAYSLTPRPSSLIFDRDGVATHLVGPLRQFERMLAVYVNASVLLLPAMPVEEAHVIEQAHTTVEVLLRAALGTKDGGGSFRQMVDHALTNGWIGAEQRALLLDMNKVRRGTKHRGQEVRRRGAYDLVMNAAQVCHQLLIAIMPHRETIELRSLPDTS